MAGNLANITMEGATFTTHNPPAAPYLGNISTTGYFVISNQTQRCGFWFEG
jgi:hypothetical protein